MANLAVLERQQQFDFQQNGIEVMDFETLQRTYKENDIYNNPVQGIYHYQVIQRMMDICEKHNLDYEVEEIFAAQNRNKTQPGVSILPQVEQIHGEKAVEAHILRRIFTTIRIKDWETDELTTTLVVAYHQDGVQAAIGPCVKICHNQCILSPERSVCNYGKKKVTTEELFDTVDGWMANFEVNMNEDIERIQRLKRRVIPLEERLKKARIDSGINQADAAKKLEMSRPTLSAIEADKRQVLASEILQFAELYNVSVLSLMSDEESEQSVKKNQMTRLLQYQSAFQKMNEDKQKQVLKYMEQLQDES